MTKVEIFNHDGRIHGFSVSGHSGYAEEGSDIVCAAVSAAVTFAECTINDVLGNHANTKVKEEEPRITLTLPGSLRRRRRRAGRADRLFADGLLPAGQLS